MKKKLAFSFFLFLLLILSFSSFAYPSFNSIQKEFRITKNVENEWLVFDTYYQSYILYNPLLHKTIRVKMLPIDINSLKKNDLYLYIPSSTYLFLNGKIVYEKKKEGWIRFTYPYIQKYIIDHSTVFISTYTPDNTTIPYSFYGYRYSLQHTSSIKKINPIDIKNQSTYQFHNFLGIAFLLIFSCLANLKYYNNKLYASFYTFKNIFKIESNENLLKKSANIDTFYCFCICGMMGAVSLFLLNHPLKSSLKIFSIIPIYQSHFSSILLLFFLLSLLGGLIYTFKFFLINWISNLFNIVSWKHLHYYYFIKISISFYCSLFFIATVIYFLNIQFPSSLLSFLGIVFLIIRTCLISYFLNKWIPIRNIYLFSYLCITEWMPLLLSVKLDLFF